MTSSSVAAAAVMATFAVTACGRARSGNDSAAAGDSASAAVHADSSAAPAPGSAPPPAATSGAPNGAAKPATAAPAGAMGTAAAHRAENTPSVPVSIDTNPKPRMQPAPGATTPAYVVFRDTILPSDLEWLRGQGFTIVTVTESTHGVRIAVPDGYHGNPKANPRVLRFTITMR